MFRKLKPVTPSLRHSFFVIKNLNKKPLLKNKIKFYKKSLGKSSCGKIINRHKQTGAKKKYRKLSLQRIYESEGIVCSIEHDPYRNAFIISVFDRLKKKFFYTLAPEHVSVGDLINTGEDAKLKAGNSLPIAKIPAGSAISNIILTPNSYGKLCRSAGSYSVLRGHLTGFSFIELMSGEIRLIPNTCYAVIGKISNDSHFLEQSGKAGKSRWLGKRPRVRGVAMNPVDHPNGGGEGKKSGFGKTPWGKPSKRGKTANNRYKLIVKKRYE